jgi:hypothetical protein
VDVESDFSRRFYCLVVGQLITPDNALHLMVPMFPESFVCISAIGVPSC